MTVDRLRYGQLAGDPNNQRCTCSPLGPNQQLLHNLYGFSGKAASVSFDTRLQSLALPWLHEQVLKVSRIPSFGRPFYLRGGFCFVSVSLSLSSLCGSIYCHTLPLEPEGSSFIWNLLEEGL